MVCIDELQATINRMQIIADNVDDETDRAFALSLKENLTTLLKQVNMASKDENFVKAILEQFKKD